MANGPSTCNRAAAETQCLFVAEGTDLVDAALVCQRRSDPLRRLTRDTQAGIRVCRLEHSIGTGRAPNRPKARRVREAPNGTQESFAVLKHLPEHARNRRRSGLMAAAFSTFVALICWLPRLSSYSDQLTFLDRLSYDLGYALAPVRPVPEMQIIEMDQRSFRSLRQDPTVLWDRSLHARLLRKLTKDGARMVAFDVFFDRAGRPDTDQELADAMRAHGKVAIGADYVPVARAGIVGNEPAFPTEVLRQAAAGVGLVILSKDSDGTVRRHFLETEDHESLPWVAARLAGAAALAEVNRLQPRWLNYYGPMQASLSRISYSDALEQADGYFREKLIFIGGAPRIKKPGEEADTFRTPYTRWDGLESPGVEVLATNFLNLLRGDSLARGPALTELALLLGVGVCLALAVPRLRPLSSLGLLLLLGAGVGAGGVWMQIQEHVWFSWLLVVGVQIPVGWIGSLLWQAQTSRKATMSEEATAVRPLAPTATEAPTLVQPEKPPAGMALHISDHELVRRIGQGAYGEVWLARNTIGMFHAVKIIRRENFREDEPYEREFRGLSKFMPISRSHPGFVHVLHLGRNDSSGYFYYVMEAADDEHLGREINPETYSPKSLAGEMKKQNRLSTPDCVQLFLHLSDALHHLHKAQLIHRDIKPGNIIFVDGLPKIADIGLVTSIPEKPNEITYLGTMGYIAPEGPGTAGADIYSLGKVMYEVFTGLDRGQFPNLPATLLGETDRLFPLLNQIVVKACEIDPGRRYQSAAEMHRELEALRPLSQTPSLGP